MALVNNGEVIGKQNKDLILETAGLFHVMGFASFSYHVVIRYTENGDYFITHGARACHTEDRVREAATVLASAPLYIEQLPDFSLQDVEDKIKKNIRDHDIKYVFDPIERYSGK